jgi:hypothetical protein
MLSSPGSDPLSPLITSSSSLLDAPERIAKSKARTLSKIHMPRQRQGLELMRSCDRRKLAPASF